MPGSVRHTVKMKKFLPAQLLLAAVLSAAPVSRASGLSIGLESLIGMPLLPSFYEPANRHFVGLSAAYPVLPRIEFQVGIAGSLASFEGPYNDVSNTHGTTAWLSAGAELEAYRTGPLRFFLGTGVDRISSHWEADDYAYEDPDEPREFWEGAFTRWAVHAEPGLELFREKQAVDWSVSLSLPFYLGFPPDMKDAGKDMDQRLNDDYLGHEGMGVRLSVGVAFGG